jgi:hypothetical protein
LSHCVFEEKWSIARSLCESCNLDPVDRVHISGHFFGGVPGHWQSNIFRFDYLLIFVYYGWWMNRTAAAVSFYFSLCQCAVTSSTRPKEKSLEGAERESRRCSTQ